MARRDLLNEDERHLLFGVPVDRESLVKHYTLSPSDGALVYARRGAANRLGFAVQMALFNHPGFSLATFGEVPKQLIAFMADQLGVPDDKFNDYAKRIQTATDHALELMNVLGLRHPAESDLGLMIEAGARAAWSTENGFDIAGGIVAALRDGGILLPTPGRIERTGIAGRARARKQSYAALLLDASAEQLTKLDDLLIVDPKTGITPLAWVREMTTAPKADNVRGLIDRLNFVRGIGIASAAADNIHTERFRQLAREGRVTPAHLLGRYTQPRRRAILIALMIDLEARLIDAALDMADRMIAGSFTRGGNTKKRVYAATTRDVGRLMRMFSRTIDALALAQDGQIDAFDAVDEAVGWHKLLAAKAEVKAIGDLAEEDPLVRASDRWVTLRKFAPALLEAIQFKAGPGSSPTLNLIEVLRENARTGRRDIPENTPMPFKKEWRSLITASGKIDRRLFETAAMAHVRNKWRSGDIWIEGSSNYRRFDSYLLPQNKVAPVAATLGLPGSADEWIKTRAAELDWRLKGFASRLAKGKLEGVRFENGKLSITPVRGGERADVDILAAKIDALMPRVRITELLHEVANETGFLSAFTNLRTRDTHSSESALLATILADGSNLGLARMAEASQGVTPDQLLWTQSAYMREDTYKGALAKIINSHHALPIASVWGQGTTSSSDGQFFRSGKRGGAAGDFNARYGVDPGFSFYTHVSDQHGPYNVKVISAATHEAPYVLDGLLHHGSSLPIDTHYTDTGGASDHVFGLCNMLGFRFCPRLRDFPDRRFASFEPITRYAAIKPLMGRRVKLDVIRAHWDDVVRLVASLKAGTVQPSVMLRKLAAYERQNQLDLALQEIGRVERSLFMLDWLESPALRQRCQAGLNKSEQRHQLTQAICTFKQGRIAERSHEAQQFRASGLNLVIAAIVYWNSTYFADAVGHLRSQGEIIPDELLAHTSPVEWNHIAFSGDFLWDRAATTAVKGRRPLNRVENRWAA
ncbi:Tn3 family transposase [Sphingobium sp. B2]|uniref:Tn3 family transposase n=1 Tax=Sphingobium sp. B2 TaxID=2583228 RepID=UPI0011A46EA5|nr:Tn3 family transposase [Sphingobium sp. B2]